MHIFLLREKDILSATRKIRTIFALKFHLALFDRVPKLVGKLTTPTKGVYAMAVTTCDVDPALMDGLCRAIIESAEEYYKDPEHVAEFEHWRHSEEGKAFLASVSGKQN